MKNLPTAPEIFFKNIKKIPYFSVLFHSLQIFFNFFFFKMDKPRTSDCFWLVIELNSNLKLQCTLIFQKPFIFIPSNHFPTYSNLPQDF